MKVGGGYWRVNARGILMIAPFFWVICSFPMKRSCVGVRLRMYVCMYMYVYLIVFLRHVQVELKDEGTLLASALVQVFFQEAFKTAGLQSS
jgi:hypothetical protein